MHSCRITGTKIQTSQFFLLLLYFFPKQTLGKGGNSVRANFFVTFLAVLFASSAVHAVPVPPNELSRKFFNSDKYYPDHYALSYFSSKSEWGNGVRVAIGPGENLKLAPNKFAFYENRYFFLNSTRQQLLQNLSLLKILGNRKDVIFTIKSTDASGKETFALTVDKSSWLVGTIIINCVGTTEMSSLNQSAKSNFFRYQVRLQKCDINGRATLVEDDWMTFDAFQFDDFSNKSGLALKAIHFNEPKTIEGHKLSETEVANLALGVENEILISLFARLGYRVDSDFLWKHQR
jgi:hypothetical protein